VLGVFPSVVSAPALDVGEARVLRRGAGLSPVSFWPSASAVRATWSSSTLANPAGGPVADPGGPVAAAPGSAWAPSAAVGARDGVVAASPGAPGVPGELFDACVPGTSGVPGVADIGADGPFMLPAAGS
jgi:hypothetical protein